jgi:hypothetical protein
MELFNVFWSAFNSGSDFMVTHRKTRRGPTPHAGPGAPKLFISWEEFIVSCTTAAGHMSWKQSKIL